LSNEEHHVALPKLYGAPAYARPPRIYDPSPRTPDLDDLPIEAFRTDEDVAVISAYGVGSAMAIAGPAGSSVVVGNGSSKRDSLQARPFSLKSLSRLLSGKD
jgi:hypothetical protein